MVRIQKKLVPLFIILLTGLSLFGCILLADNKKVFTGESKHWKARFEITKYPDSYGTNGGLQLEYLGEKLPISKFEYEFNAGSHESKGFSKRVDTKKVSGGRSKYDFEEVQNINTLPVDIKWDGLEEKIQLKPEN
jgi:hypothetical protein